MYQLRICTLQTADALDCYATVRWPRHGPSLRAFGVHQPAVSSQLVVGVSRLP